MTGAARRERLRPDECSVISDTRCALGEAPTWSVRRQSLLWVDLPGGTIHEWSPRHAEVRHYRLPDTVSWVIECRGEDLFVAGIGARFTQLRLPAVELSVLGSPEAAPGMRLNDAKADARGRIFAGTMPIAADRASGGLFRFDPDGVITRVDGGYTIPNGPAFSTDGGVLYHSDSARNLIFRFDVREDGSLGPRNAFLEFPSNWGMPDGMTVDAEDHLWVAHWGTGCVSRFAPSGERVEVLELPTPQITSCAFGGAALDRLFVTSAAVDRPGDPLAGALFELAPGTHGCAAHAFGG